jgi:hypothetical protein
MKISIEEASAKMTVFAVKLYNNGEDQLAGRGCAKTVNRNNK